MNLKLELSDEVSMYVLTFLLPNLAIHASMTVLEAA
jgi:hypothetical protein